MGPGDGGLGLGQVGIGRVLKREPGGGERADYRWGCPPAEPAHSGCGYPPTCRGSLRVWVEGGRPRTSRVKPCPSAGPKVPLKWTRLEVPPLPGLTAMPTGWQRSSCPYLELCPALVRGEWALKAGGPRSSSLGGGEEAGGTSAPSLPRTEASAAKGQGWGCTGVRSVLGSLPGRLPP